MERFFYIVGPDSRIMQISHAKGPGASSPVVPDGQVVVEADRQTFDEMQMLLATEGRGFWYDEHDKKPKAREVWEPRGLPPVTTVQGRSEIRELPQPGTIVLEWTEPQPLRVRIDNEEMLIKSPFRLALNHVGVQYRIDVLEPKLDDRRIVIAVPTPTRGEATNGK